MLLSELGDLWIAFKREEVGASTLYTYERILRTSLHQRFSDRRLDSIRPVELQSVLVDSLERRSENEALKTRAVLRGLFAYAHDLGLVESDPAARIRLPKGTGNHPGSIHQVPTPQDALTMSRTLPPDVSLMPVLAAYAGLRWQEVAALQTTDFDVASREITVVRAIGRHEGVKKPKTLAGTRKTVWADEVTHLIASTLEKTEGNWMFTNRSGGLLGYSNWRRRQWVPACERAGLEWTFHQYRHTFAVESLRRGRSVQSVAAMMGHSNPRVTWEFYAGLFEDHLEEARRRW